MIERIVFKIFDWLFLDAANRSWERQLAKHAIEMNELRKKYLRKSTQGV